MIYYRVDYEGTGIYEAFKMELWKKSDVPKEEWDKLKSSDVFKWLPVPPNAYSNCKSYFKKSGYELFIKYTYPEFIKYLDKNKINIKKYELKRKDINIIYEDIYQIVIAE